MPSCKPSTTPMDTQAKLSGSYENSYHASTEYCNLVGALQYLTFTSTSYVVQKLCLLMHDPKTHQLC